MKRWIHRQQTFFICKKWFESEKKAEKKRKIKRKKLQIFFCLAAFTREGKMSVIKIACFILNFLNLKSKPRHLFFWVASSLSILWTQLAPLANSRSLTPFQSVLDCWTNWSFLNWIFNACVACYKSISKFTFAD